MSVYQKIKLLLTGLFLSCSINAQTIPASQYDFWIGKWDLTWEQPNGNMGKGTNHIHKILDGKVIQENFEATEGQLKGFKGASISVYNPAQKSWRQAWADNQGGYLNFIGEIEGDRKIFKTVNDEEKISRMVFYDITENSLTWDWEKSTDGGKTWQLSWRIFYKRMKSNE